MTNWGPAQNFQTSVYTLSELANNFTARQSCETDKISPLTFFPAVLFLLLCCPIVLVLSYFLNIIQIKLVMCIYFISLYLVLPLRSDVEYFCVFFVSSGIRCQEMSKASYRETKYHQREIIKTSKDWMSVLESKLTPM